MFRKPDKKHFSKTVVASLVLSTTLLTPSCWQNPKSKVANRSIELADRLTPQALNPEDGVTATRQRVYVDSSLSMQGFIGESGRSVFDEFLDAMPDVMPGCEVFRYGESASPESEALKIDQITTKVQFDQQLHNRGLYTRKFNPDATLINGLVEDQEPALSIVITDGVESDAQGQVNTAVVNSIRSWMNRRGIFAILVMKSKFAGKFYSERQRRIVDEKAEIPARPFYALVFSPSMRDFEDLQDKLRRRFPELKSLLFSDDAITCQAEIPVDSAAGYAQESPPDKPYYWQMLTAQNFPSGSEDQITYHFSYKIKSTYPAGLLGIRTQSKLYRWNPSGQFDAEGTASQTQPAVESANPDDNRTQIFDLRPQPIFQQAAQDDYRFYAIEQSVYIKEIDRDIVELSTPDDSEASTGGRTYRFQELIYALMDVHLKDRLLSRMSPRLYITVAKN